MRRYLDFYSMNMPRDFQVFEFYNGRGDRYSGNRVTVIDPEGQIVGRTDFVMDEYRTEQNWNADIRQNRTRQTIVYDFDKNALDAQIIDAFSQDKPR